MDNSRSLLLMTRPSADSQGFIESLPANIRQRVDLIVSPLIDISYRGTLPETDGYSALIFSSKHGVAAFAALGGASNKPAFAVGETTAKAAEAQGFSVKCASGNADDLINLIQSYRPKGHLLHVRGQHTTGNVAKRLTDAGVQTDETIIYEQKLMALTNEAVAALSQDRRVIAPLFSPRTAQAFVAESPKPTHLWVAAISAAVAQVLPGSFAEECEIANTPSGVGMRELVTAMVEKASRN